MKDIEFQYEQPPERPYESADAAYVPLAAEIVRRVDEAAANVGNMSDQSAPDMVQSLDQILGDVEAELRRTRFTELYRELPWEGRAKVLLTHLEQSPEMRDAIQAEGDYILRRQSHMGQLQKLRDEGTTAFAIPVERIPVGSNVELELFGSADYNEAETPADVIDNFQYARYVRGRKAGGNRLLVESDYHQDAYTTSQVLVNRTVALGTPLPGTNDTYITYGAPVTVDGQPLRLTDQYGTTDEVVLGRMHIDRIEIFGYNIAP